MGKREISEAKLWRKHDKEGKKKYGKKWDMANFGWVSSESDIASKVYGNPTLIFSSYIENRRIKHREEKY